MLVPSVRLHLERKRSTIREWLHDVGSSGAGQGLTGLAVALHVGGPEREVVAQQLHDERGVLVRLLGERVQLGDGVVEGRLRQPARAVRAVQDFVVEYLQHARDNVTMVPANY